MSNVFPSTSKKLKHSNISATQNNFKALFKEEELKQPKVIKEKKVKKSQKKYNKKRLPKRQEESKSLLLIPD